MFFCGPVDFVYPCISLAWSCESTEDLEAARQEKASAGLIAVTDKVECSFSSLSFFCVCVCLRHVVH